MPTMVTRKQIEAARETDCGWTEEGLAESMEKRFPGGGAIDLGKWIEVWLNDESLSHATLGQCSMLAAKLAPAPADPDVKKPRGSLLLPRPALEKIAASLP